MPWVSDHFLFKGIFNINDDHLKLTICPRHRDKFGIRWRSNKRNCTAPSGWFSHGKSVLGERGISLPHAKLLHQLTQVLLPVGSRECLAILLFYKIDSFCYSRETNRRQ